jgi:hypothetical protein
MATAAGGIELTRLLRVPAEWPERALLAAATGLWLLALPRLLALGPGGLSGKLAALGLLLVAALPLLGTLATLLSGAVPGPLAGWLLPPLALLLGALLLGALLRAPEQTLTAAQVAVGALALGLLAWPA